MSSIAGLKHKGWQVFVNEDLSTIIRSNTKPYLRLFFERVSEIKTDSRLLAKLIVIINRNEFTDDNLKKIQKLYEQTIAISENNKLVFSSSFPVPSTFQNENPPHIYLSILRSQ